MKEIKKVLVTGGAGYVGAVLVPKLLQKGYEVTVLDWYLYNEDVFLNYRGKIGLREVKGDIRDKKLLEKELKGMDAVVHLACISNDPSFELNPELGRSINYDATLLVTDIAKASGVKRFIYASSSSVYGVRDERDVNEELSLRPLTDYSKYKAMSEEYILDKGSREFTVLVLRPATVCGYSPRLRLDLTVNMLTLQALVNRTITVFGGSQKRPNIHIEDMTDLYVRTLEYPTPLISGKVFNAGYENYSVGDIAQMIVTEVGDSEVKVVYTPTNDLRSYHISSKKIAQELGFKPTKSLEDAISGLVGAYTHQHIKDPMDNERYYNVKMMKSHRIT